MKNYKKKYFVVVVLWVILLSPSAYYGFQQIQENKIMDNYLAENKLVNLPVNKQTAVLVSEAVRKDFSVDENKFVSLNLNKRPFLREDTAFLLTYREGVCGEGTRVIVNLLNRLGFDATRLTLYNQQLESKHTLVSVVINSQEFLVNSINSSDEVSRLLGNNDISTKEFNLLHYTDDIGKRHGFKKIKSENESVSYKYFFDRYRVYSYEAMPYTKILTKLGFDVRVFNFKRPSKIASKLAEKPNMIMAGVSFVLAILIIAFMHRFKIVARIIQ